MKLDKAIKVGKHISLPFLTTSDYDNHLALRILIEAGERLNENRAAGYWFGPKLLDGETEE